MVFPIPTAQMHFETRLCLFFLQSMWFSTGPWLQFMWYHSLVHYFSVQWIFIRVVNEMDKILTHIYNMYVTVENSSQIPQHSSQHFLYSEPRLKPIFSYLKCFGHFDFRCLFWMGIAFIPLDCNASFPASPPVSNYIHYLLSLFKSQRMS